MTDLEAWLQEAIEEADAQAKREDIPCPAVYSQLSAALRRLHDALAESRLGDLAELATIVIEIASQQEGRLTDGYWNEIRSLISPE